MEQRTFNSIVGSVLSVVAVLHLLRAVYSWEAVIGGWMVPVWVSYVAVLVAGFLAYSAFRLNR